MLLEFPYKETAYLFCKLFYENLQEKSILHNEGNFFAMLNGI